MATIKARKEAFVTGHEGTTPQEVFLICLSTTFGLALYKQVLLRVSIFGNSIVVGVVLEVVIVILPIILCQSTWLFPWGVTLLLTELIVACALAMTLPPKLQRQQQYGPSKSRSPTLQQRSRRLGFITAYRSSLLLLTFCAILAVDFPFFPRRFAKTEVGGYGFMDLGAASTIVAAGIMASSSSSSTTKRPFKIRQWLIFVALGLLRLVTHKNVEYQEHVSEYGVHWNFYFTLAFISLLGSVTTGRFSSVNKTSTAGTATISSTWPFISPVLVLCIYQIALLSGLQHFIEYAPRQCRQNEETTIHLLGWLCDLVASNREGIFGCVGYFFLWWASQQIGRDCIVWTQESNPENTKQNNHNNTTSLLVTLRRGHPMRLTLVSVALWLLHAILVHGIWKIPVSRRSTNASFCVWTLAHNFSLLTIFWWVLGDMETTTAIGDDDTQGGRLRVLPSMCVAINRHGMTTFVVANLLTGLVNMSISTLDTGNGMALAILLMYLLAVGCLALALDSNHLQPFHQRLLTSVNKGD